MVRKYSAIKKKAIAKCGFILVQYVKSFQAIQTSFLVNFSGSMCLGKCKTTK